MVDLMHSKSVATVNSQECEVASTYSHKSRCFIFKQVRATGNSFSCVSLKRIYHRNDFGVARNFLRYMPAGQQEAHLKGRNVGSSCVVFEKEGSRPIPVHAVKHRYSSTHS